MARLPAGDDATEKRRERKQGEASRSECTLLCMTDCESDAQQRHAERSSFSAMLEPTLP
jgi:hypothetical protein